VLLAQMYGKKEETRQEEENNNNNKAGASHVYVYINPRSWVLFGSKKCNANSNGNGLRSITDGNKFE
jgi:hypothetical protein